MKKFLIFLVSIVVVVCVGLTTFYFLKNDEIISIETKEIYVNAGDTITLEELGLSRKKASKKTTFNYNAASDEVKDAVFFDESKGYYIVTGNVAGDVTLVITTSNKKYAEFTVAVHIGNGEKNTPYYVFNQTDLEKIGADYALTSYFKLMNNISLSSNFAPIGYSAFAEKYVGFSGNFDGNGKTISGLNLTSSDYSNAGLFSSINSNAVVSNLTIANATISGAYKNAGVLAGSISGDVDRIAILSSSVLSNVSNANIGALAGCISGSAMLTYADGVNVTVGSAASTEEKVDNPNTETDETDNSNTETGETVESAEVAEATKDVNAGGLFGKIDQAIVQASYVNNATVSIAANSTGNFGGFAGCFVVGLNSENKPIGSIQQSYANVESTYSNFGAFLGGILAEGVEDSDAIRIFIGNAVVLNGKEIVTAGNYNANLFASFKDTTNSTYLIDSFATQDEMQTAATTNNGLVFYAIDSLQVYYWDVEYIWQTSTSGLPTLRFTSINPEGINGEYFRKDLQEKEINETNSTFDSVFSGDVSDMKYTLKTDITVSNHTPANLKNVTLDGNNKTITLSLNNKNGNNLGLFGKLDNCTIKNLNIIITDVTANATNIGAVAGTTTSTDSLSSSSLENVTITFQKVGNVTATNFGGVVAVAEKTNIKNVSVTGLNVSANIDNVGGAVAELKTTATTDNVSVNATLSGNKYVGGVVAKNNGNITNVKNSSVVLNYNANVEEAELGGIAATNFVGSILDSNIAVEININNANNSIYAGGVASTNNGTIKNVTVTGKGISVAEEINANVYIGGIVATNNSNIELVTTTMTSVGANFVNNNIKAAGVACVNAGTISKVVTKTNVYGNFAGGAFVEISNSDARADQVVISNTVKGEKYAAGVIVVFKAGEITNIQATSTIEGASNSARCSLVTLVFPQGAKLKCATIDSSFAGYGSFYREVWTDFSAYTNKSEFGLENLSKGVDARFNLYNSDTNHGCMQSVVINISNDKVSGANYSCSKNFMWFKEYSNTGNSSFVYNVNNNKFHSASTFSGTIEFTYATSTIFGADRKEKRELQFAIGTIWVDNGNGIGLAFANK